MRNKYLKLVMLFSIVASFFAFETSSFAATIGQELASPEAGWQRYEDDSNTILYQGSWETNSNTDFYTAGHDNSTTDVDALVRFNFRGTEIRIISNRNNTRVDNLQIVIDGNTETFSEYTPSTEVVDSRRILVYEKKNLANAVHTVTISSPSTETKNWNIDAIDIDASGYLMAVDKNELTGDFGSASANLTWTSIEGAGAYTVNRSLTSNGPYFEIGTTDALSYRDMNVVNGTTYYYIITAKNGDGLDVSSNEASVTPVESPSNAILTITMTNGLEKEYDLSMDEVNDFFSWYEGKEAGAGTASYAIDKHENNKGPFKSRKDYVIFDKILTFSVDEYDQGGSAE